MRFCVCFSIWVTLYQRFELISVISAVFNRDLRFSIGISASSTGILTSHVQRFMLSNTWLLRDDLKFHRVHREIKGFGVLDFNRIWLFGWPFIRFLGYPTGHTIFTYFCCLVCEIVIGYGLSWCCSYLFPYFVPCLWLIDWLYFTDL